MEKLRRWMFYVLRPHYLPEALRRVRRRIGLNLLPKLLGRDRGPAERWAAARAVSEAEAIAQLTGSPPPAPLEVRFQDVWSDARARVARCPVRMGGGAFCDLLFEVSKLSNANRVVETGVAYGWSSLAFLLALRPSGGHLTSIDMPYPGRGNDSHVGCAVSQTYRDLWTLERYPDSIALPRVLRRLDGPLDLFHYDSDKQYEGRIWAYPLAWRYLRAGGWLISDDIDDNTAFRDFCEHLNLQPLVVHGIGAGSNKDRYVGLLQKPVGGATAFLYG